MANSSLDYRRDAREWMDGREPQGARDAGRRPVDGPARDQGPLEERWPRQRVVALACVWIAGALVLAALSVAAHRSSTFPVDPGIARAVQRLGGTPIGGLVELAGNANWPLPAIIGLVVIFATLLVLRLFRAAIGTAVAGFGSDLTNLALNTIVARPRPNGIHIPTLGGLGSHSFPSGHVAHTLGLYGFVFYLCWRAERTERGAKWRPWLIAVQVISVVFIVTVGPSRVMEREHWPSDVLAGYLVGGLVLILAIALYHTLTLRRSAPDWVGARLAPEEGGV